MMWRQDLRFLRRYRSAAALCVALLAWSWPRQPGAEDARPAVDLRIVAINDFHGNLEPPPGGIRISDPDDPTRKIPVTAGGAERMATVVRQLRSGVKNSIFVAAGDLIGASPFLSAMFHDEPTVEALSMMGLDIASVGNHEFDEGKDELLRMQNGGCHPIDGCQGPHPFLGAKFRYLAASTIEKSTGKPVFPPYEVKEFDGIPVAFIGLTLRETADIVSPSGVKTLDFKDEVETVNALVPELTARGIQAIIVLIHQGGIPTGDYNECPNLTGPIVDLVPKFDKAVDIVVSGHTHQAYTCVIDGRLVTSADKYGTLITQIDVKLDPVTRDIIAAKANNLIIRTDTYAKEPAQTELIASFEKLAGPVANRPAGTVTASLSRIPSLAGESALGDIVADAQLAATRSEANGAAVLALTNPGGVRTDILMKEGGAVTYADVFASQPFRNQLVTMTLTGAQIREALEHQWIDPLRPRILHASRGFSYTWDAKQPFGNHVLPETMMLNGRRIEPATAYRVTVNNYLADGGDGFVTFKAGTERRFGIYDVEALDAYFKTNSPISPGPLDRIVRVN